MAQEDKQPEWFPEAKVRPNPLPPVKMQINPRTCAHGTAVHQSPMPPPLTHPPRVHKTCN